jgi:predicted secreted acid phosphatase
MTPTDSKSWRLNRQVNLSVIVQIVLLASLIVGSWVNLQRQLDLLQRDVSMLLQSQNTLQQKLDALWTQSLSHEYRLQAVEKHFTKANITLEGSGP